MDLYHQFKAILGRSNFQYLVILSVRLREFPCVPNLKVLKLTESTTRTTLALATKAQEGLSRELR